MKNVKLWIVRNAIPSDIPTIILLLLTALAVQYPGALALSNAQPKSVSVMQQNVSPEDATVADDK